MFVHQGWREKGAGSLPRVRGRKDTQGVPGGWDVNLCEHSSSPDSSVTLCPVGACGVPGVTARVAGLSAPSTRDSGTLAGRLVTSPVTTEGATRVTWLSLAWVN